MESLLIPNHTFFIQLALFFVSYFFLNRFVFRPYVRLLDLRREKTIGLKEQAVRDKQEADQLKLQYEQFMQEERRKVSAWLEAHRKEVSDQAAVAVATAREEATQKQRAAETKLAVEVATVRKQLNESVDDLASRIASKLMDQKIKVSGADLRSSSLHAETTAG